MKKEGFIATSYAHLGGPEGDDILYPFISFQKNPSDVTQRSSIWMTFNLCFAPIYMKWGEERDGRAHFEKP